MSLPHKHFSIAPMMGYTTRFFRLFARLLSPSVHLYTEMIHAQAILNKNPKLREKQLYFYPQEHPVTIQLGGNNPAMLAEAAKIAADYGYDEINLNVGCPSKKVQAGAFGACLFKQPELVAEIVAAIRTQINIPVTVKTRIGVDEMDADQHLDTFINHVHAAGCNKFIIHARKAWLKGLNPKQNRSIPPLNYDRVYQLKQQFPQLEIVLNGGLDSVAAAQEALKHVDGVMLGRAILQRPLLLKEMENFFTGSQQDFSIVDKIEYYFASTANDFSRYKNLILIPLLSSTHGTRYASVFRAKLMGMNNIAELIAETKRFFCDNQTFGIPLV